MPGRSDAPPCPESGALAVAARRARAGAVGTADRLARIAAYGRAQQFIEQALQEHTNARGFSTAVHDALRVVYARLDDAILKATEEA